VVGGDLQSVEATVSDDAAPDTTPTGTPPVVTAALALVGLAYPDQRYLDAIAPGETPERQAVMGRESSCGLVWISLNGGVAPYHDGQAFADVWRLAGGAPWAPGGRVRRPSVDDSPVICRGDAIFYNASQGGQYPAHIDAAVTSTEDCGGYIKIMAVAGGQRDSSGNECIKLMQRSLHWIGGRLVDPATGREVGAIIAAG
jgi:hypothetical protein